MAHTGLPVAKAHAYGNDFLFVRDQDFHVADLPAFARAACDRHTGIGADGLIAYRRTHKGASIRLMNSDGSHAELSGNGVRCLAALLLYRGEAEASAVTPIAIESEGGTKLLYFVERSDRQFRFRARMGHPERVQQQDLQLGGECLRATVLWMGNPQCVVLGPLPDRERFHRLGPALARHPSFPAGTNVEFAEVVSPELDRILIWERGAGPTRSSGTGSCAAAVAARTYGGADADLEVAAPGGSQRVRWTADGVELEGWADVVLEGVWLA